MQTLLALLVMWTGYAIAAPIEIEVHVAGGLASGMVLTLAEAQASRLLREAGVQVRWVRSHTRGCDELHAIDVAILWQSQANDHPGALGYALPFAKSGVRVTIFYDRLKTAELRPNPELLGHVLAHELGHVLMATQVHGSEGIMKAHWTRAEIEHMQAHPMRFTEDDADAIARRFQSVALVAISQADRNR